MFTDPFPNPETHLVAIDHASTSQVLILSATKPKNDVLVIKQSKYYSNPPFLSNNHLEVEQPKVVPVSEDDRLIYP